jgi:hypothetical protein
MFIPRKIWQSCFSISSGRPADEPKPRDAQLDEEKQLFVRFQQKTKKKFFS